jgi:mRNA interferase HigB
MRIIAKRTLRAFWQKAGYGDSKGPLQAWYQHVSHADWASPGDVKADFGNASILKGNRVVFNIYGNKYRLVVKVNFPYRVVYVRFIGTHAQYDDIGAETI